MSTRASCKPSNKVVLLRVETTRLLLRLLQFDVLVLQRPRLSDECVSLRLQGDVGLRE